VVVAALGEPVPRESGVARPLVQNPQALRAPAVALGERVATAFGMVGGPVAGEGRGGG
jgi:hypothetical protein